MPPKPYEETALDIAGLKIGDRVTVQSSEDIGESGEFVAANITVSEGTDEAATTQPTSADIDLILKFNKGSESPR